LIDAEIHLTKSLKKPGFYDNTQSQPKNSEKTRFLNLTRQLNKNSPVSAIVQTILPTSSPPTMRHWPPGQQLHQGKYLIEEILGGGGFGVTYRAQNLKEGKAVAIKTLNANVQGKPNFREFQTKFVNEALSLASAAIPTLSKFTKCFPKRWEISNCGAW
jgi:hypothetical protein